MRKIRILKQIGILFILATLLCALCACARSGGGSPSATQSPMVNESSNIQSSGIDSQVPASEPPTAGESDPTIPSSEPSVTPSFAASDNPSPPVMSSANTPAASQSVTYVRAGNNLYLPVSYVVGGKQMLTGDFGSYSLSAKKLQGVPAVATVGQVNTTAMYTNDSDPYNNPSPIMDTIASNGDWDFFPAQVKYEKYTLENQPDNREWSDYFTAQLAAVFPNTPVVMTESWVFNWTGKKVAVVTASNAIVSGDENSLYMGGDNPSPALPNPPSGDNTVIYMMSAIFIDGSAPLSVIGNTQKIETNPIDESANVSLSYAPPQDSSTSYQQFFSAVQTDANGFLICPIFNDMNGEYALWSYECDPLVLVCDIDGDGVPEILTYINNNSSDMCLCTVYKLENGNPEKVFSIVPN